jgi:spore maturation protein CgeB
MNIVVLGLTLTSSWGNGHATTYRALLRALAARGHDILFLERDAYWYRDNRDLPSPSFCRVRLYHDLTDLKALSAVLRDADAVVVGSYVPEGAKVIDLVQRTARGVTAFYDIDTPVTLARLGGLDYLEPGQISGFDIYFSFTGGPTLTRLEHEHGARRALPLYCSVDPALYFPEQDERPPSADLGYLGTYSDDRQPVLERLLIEPARRWPEGRFLVAGPQYPDTIRWPANVARTMHLDPSKHRGFYTGLRFTLNVTRRDMVAAGYSPSVRLFEAAACGTPVISDSWPGLEEFFTPGAEILVAGQADDVLERLRNMPEAERRRVGERARTRVLANHTSAHRAREFEAALASVRPKAAAVEALHAARPAGPLREACS